MVRTLLATAVALVFMALPAQAIDNERTKILDEQIRPLLNKFKAEPNRENLNDLGRAVQTFNRPRTSLSATTEEAAPSLDPMWLSTQLREQAEKGATAAALSLCGEKLHSCDFAKERLKKLTSQCSHVFLGVIDLKTYPGTALNLYDTADPELILMDIDPETKQFKQFNLLATINETTVATALCPRESKTWGPAMRVPVQ